MGSNFNDQSKTPLVRSSLHPRDSASFGKGGAHGLTTKPIHTGSAMALVDEPFDEMTNARNRLIEAILRAFL